MEQNIYRYSLNILLRILLMIFSRTLLGNPSKNSWASLDNLTLNLDFASI